ncbi:IMP-specific 5-prime-nucleotidase family protein [Blumeria hordei DH14]|uniref:IMP-specific 5'-nucleotidase 1 n=1 Tax=Blumeria graminis f. sp. hordei (strain DH14) TaxID=546991 RepID=N1JI28_BLUG1|nr:IMP-specific 5-prime-nucleotidase family protein [Blumeria hordei DH14]
MTTRYRVEYALKTHRRDQFIEWIKGLLAVPFILYSQPTGVFESRCHTVQQMAEEAHRRYAEIMQDVEEMIDDHIQHQKVGLQGQSKLKLLVPSTSTFFTRLPLANAFRYQDRKRFISSRRFVPPSFNDIRLILNTAQLMAVTSTGQLGLATFDGDVTLYDDGNKDTKVGIVTAAGYTQAERYYQRLHGLLEAVKASDSLTPAQKENLVVMGGESNFLFTFALDSPYLLSYKPRRSWILPDMSTWTQDTITALLDLAESCLRECIANLSLDATLIRKERAVGIIPSVSGYKFPRESLEETVLVIQKKLEMSDVGRLLPFCAFNGGNDVFVDIGDKSWGVLVCQDYFGSLAHSNSGKESQRASTRIGGETTLHVGDQFLSAGSNDFKARVVGTTAWIANPAETCELLDEVQEFIEYHRNAAVHKSTQA